MTQYVQFFRICFLTNKQKYAKKISIFFAADSCNEPFVHTTERNSL